MTTSIYVRVSSRKQDQASQLPDLKAFAEKAGGKVAWYSEKASGKTMDRPAWKKLEAEIRAGKVDQLVVWRIDRLGRTASGLASLFDLLVEKKVNLVCLRDGIDLSTPTGRLVAGVLAHVAVYETEVRAERTVSGQAIARAKGKHMGRPKRKPGDPPDPRAVTEEKKAIVRQLARDMSKAAVARATGLHPVTVFRILKESPSPSGSSEACTTGPIACSADHA